MGRGGGGGQSMVGQTIISFKANQIAYFIYCSRGNIFITIGGGGGGGLTEPTHYCPWALAQASTLAQLTTGPGHSLKLNPNSTTTTTSTAN